MSSGMGLDVAPFNGSLSTDGVWYDIHQVDVVLLVYNSFWLGALGWEVLLTIPFDIRLLVETNWKSLLSFIHSVSYFLSRYATLSFIAYYIYMASPAQDDCQSEYAISGSLFTISVCSINLVFLLRTCAIWNFRWKAVIPLVISLLSIVAFSITFTVKVVVKPIDGYCSISGSGFYVGAIFVSVAIFSFVCFLLTVNKLNHRGWKSVARGLLPKTCSNLDSEDVRLMLVQRTTAFFAISIALITILAACFYAEISNGYKLMNIVAFKSVTASVAGKIFRKSWRLTRDVKTGRLNRPPSYFPAWAEKRDESQDYNWTFNHKSEKDNYVEGDFGGTKTPAQMLAARHCTFTKEDGSVNGQDVGVDINSSSVLEANHRPLKSSVAMPMAAVVDSAMTIVQREKGKGRNGMLPFTKNPLSNSQSRLEMEERRTSGASLSSLLRERVSPTQSSQTIQWIADDGITTMIDPTVELATISQISREDLNKTPTRSKLWLDSRAERARMEAANSGMISPSFASVVIMTGDGATNSHAPSTSSSTRTAQSQIGKRVILDHASEVGKRLNDHWATFGNQEERSRLVGSSSSPKLNSSIHGEDKSAAAPSTLRASFLPSPGIISRVEPPVLHRRNYDLDVIRKSLQTTDVPRPKTQENKSLIRFIVVEDNNLTRDDQHRQQYKEPTVAVRPKTAPSRPSQERVSQIWNPTEEPADPIDPVAAFHQVIEEDALDRKNGVEDATRPRTSRGGRLGPFGQPVDVVDEETDRAIGLSIANGERKSEERPSTSHGGPDVKPFGASEGLSRRISAIEAQYQILAAYVGEETEVAKCF